MDVITALLLVLLALVLWLTWRLARLSKGLGSAGESSPAAIQLLQREVQAVRSGLDDRLRDHLHQTHELALRIGELIDALPRDTFRTQYTYPASGVRVDAAIFFGDGRLLPIDSKFPLENFRRFVDLRASGSSDADAAHRAFGRDVRRHIDEIAGKYLSPDDGAIDAAFMYIPSESVFHELTTDGMVGGGTSLAEYATRKRVVPVSPNTLHAYLSVVRMGLRGFQLQQSAREVLQHLAHLGSDVEDLRSKLDTAIRQARHSLSNFEDAESALRRVESRMGALTAGDSIDNSR
jgi:DNA recombination protein RmuC